MRLAVFAKRIIFAKLQFIAEQYQQDWAAGMTTLLRESYQAVQAVRQQGQSRLTTERLHEFERRYAELIARGLAVNPAPSWMTSTCR